MIFRVHAVFQALQRAGTRGASAAKIARECEVSEKTIYRDMDTLRDLGVAVKSQSEGWPIKGFALADRQQFPIPMPKRSSV